MDRQMIELMDEVFGNLKTQDLDNLVKGATLNKEIFQSYIKLQKVMREIIEACQPFVDTV